MTAPVEPATTRPQPLDEKQDIYGDAIETVPTAESPSQSRSINLLPAGWRFWEKWPTPNGQPRGVGTDADFAIATSNLTPLPDEAKKQGLARAWQVLWKFLTFMGPGALISVAYIDPDNYQTQIQSGQDFEYKLLFMILVSNVIAIYLQYLALKLGTVTGLDLAQMNNRHLPRWLELLIYFIAEACIICTDISQVVGTAFAWSLLIPQLPLIWACVITAADTLLILLFYSPTGQIRRIRIFEVFVSGLVIAVFITVCIALSQVTAPPGLVFRGFLPSRDIFVSQGLYTSCAILGGALMPHALYVGSAVARPRLLAYDVKYQITTFAAANTKDESGGPGGSSLSRYRPSLRAIRSCLSYSTWELSLTIFIVAVFVNSALIIVSGATFYNNPDAGFDDLYSLYALFQDTISDAAATIFAVSLLFSGVSAGIVATMAGQTVMEAAWKIRLHPFWRRLVTRSVAIVPALIICTAHGEFGMAQALVACNYVLAIGLIFVTLPLVWYVTHERYMGVPSDDGTGVVSFRNSVIGIGVAWFIWIVIVFMDIATVVLLGLGVTSDG